MKTKESSASSAKALQSGGVWSKKSGDAGKSATVLTANADFSLNNEEKTETRMLGLARPGKPTSREVDQAIETLALFVKNPAQFDETIVMLQNLSQLHCELLRQRSTGSAIAFFEDKPEIYNHDSLAFHILRNAKMRNDFMREVGALTSEEVAELSQSQAKNRAAHAHRIKTENKIFAVAFQGDQRYPAFQFDAHSGKPKPVIKQMLEVVKDQWSGWQLALWFVTPNGYLDDKTPLERLDAAPEAVLEALRKEAGEVEF